MGFIRLKSKAVSCVFDNFFFVPAEIFFYYVVWMFIRVLRHVFSKCGSFLNRTVIELSEMWLKNGVIHYTDSIGDWLKCWNQFISTGSTNYSSFGYRESTVGGMDINASSRCFNCTNAWTHASLLWLALFLFVFGRISLCTCVCLHFKTATCSEPLWSQLNQWSIQHYFSWHIFTF